MSQGTDNKILSWCFTKAELCDTPSTRAGLPLELERRFRKDAVRFIADCGKQMGLGHKSIATAVVYLHRFYMFHSFEDFPRYVMSATCLFLAGKAEETPKRCRDLMRVVRKILKERDFQSFGACPIEEVMKQESVLLATLKFDFDVSHPYEFLATYVKCLKDCELEMQNLLQMAWNFVNDSLCTVLCLEWEPEVVAIALIHLATKIRKVSVVDWTGRTPKTVRWWDQFVAGLTVEQVDDICQQVLNLYESHEPEAKIETPLPQAPPPRLSEKPAHLQVAKAQNSVGVADTDASKRVGKRPFKCVDSFPSCTVTSSKDLHCLWLPPPPPPPSPVPKQHDSMIATQPPAQLPPTPNYLPTMRATPVLPTQTPTSNYMHRMPGTPRALPYVHGPPHHYPTSRYDYLNTRHGMYLPMPPARMPNNAYGMYNIPPPRHPLGPAHGFYGMYRTPATQPPMRAPDFFTPPPRRFNPRNRHRR